MANPAECFCTKSMYMLQSMYVLSINRKTPIRQIEEDLTVEMRGSLQLFFHPSDVYFVIDASQITDTDVDDESSSSSSSYNNSALQYYYVSIDSTSFTYINALCPDVAGKQTAPRARPIVQILNVVFYNQDVCSWSQFDCVINNKPER